jgi:hypothetical protein
VPKSPPRNEPFTRLELAALTPARRPGIVFGWRRSRFPTLGCAWPTRPLRKPLQTMRKRLRSPVWVRGRRASQLGDGWVRGSPRGGLDVGRSDASAASSGCIGRSRRRAHWWCASPLSRRSRWFTQRLRIEIWRTEWVRTGRHTGLSAHGRRPTSEPGRFSRWPWGVTGTSVGSRDLAAAHGLPPDSVHCGR